MFGLPMHTALGIKVCEHFRIHTVTYWFSVRSTVVHAGCRNL